MSLVISNLYSLKRLDISYNFENFQVWNLQTLPNRTLILPNFVIFELYFYLTWQLNLFEKSLNSPRYILFVLKSFLCYIDKSYAYRIISVNSCENCHFYVPQKWKELHNSLLVICIENAWHRQPINIDSISSGSIYPLWKFTFNESCGKHANRPYSREGWKIISHCNFRIPANASITNIDMLLSIALFALITCIVSSSDPWIATRIAYE